MAESPLPFPQMQLRPAQLADAESILTLLEPQEFVHPLTRKQLRALFEYRWVDPKGDLGLVLTADGAVVGYQCLIYSPPRLLDGRSLVVATPGPFFIQPEYRRVESPAGVVRYSVEMTRAVMNHGFPVVGFSAQGPNDVVPRLLESLGWEKVSAAELFYQVASGPGLLEPEGTVLTAPAEVRRCLDQEQIRILDDHKPYGCRFYVVREGEDRCFVVTRRRRYRGEWLWPSVTVDRIGRRRFPVSDVLHISDPVVAARSWGRLVAHIAYRDRSVGVVCSESFLGSDAPPGSLISKQIWAYGRITSLRSIDKLYSELVLLP